jgi:hypothetical protein
VLGSILLCACGGSLDKPKRFTQDAPIQGGMPPASAVDPGNAILPVTTGSGVMSSPQGAERSSTDAGSDAAMRGAPATPSVPSCVSHLFSQRCAGSGCHGAGSARLDLVSAGVRDRLLDGTALPALDCAGRMYISTTGSSSLLLDKLENPPPCGERMPAGATLKKHDMQCLSDWVHSLTGSDLDAGGP